APALFGLPAAGAVHSHVIGPALAGTTIPADEQVAVRTFDKARAVIVQRFRGKNQFGFVERLRQVIVGPADCTEAEKNDPDRKAMAHVIDPSSKRSARRAPAAPRFERSRRAVYSCRVRLSPIAQNMGRAEQPAGTRARRHRRSGLLKRLRRGS